ncbi:MAG: serine hydroxymethyltransferase [Candidatus Limnocylindria bacterium]
MDILSLVERHERWRGEECLNLQPSENLVSPQVKRALGSDLAGRYTLPWSGEIHGSAVHNAYGGTRYLDQIEAAGEELARAVFRARHASLKPLSGHVAGVIAILATTAPGDTILAVAGANGGYDGYGSDYIPRALGGTRHVEALPFYESAWQVDTDAAATKIHALRPALVLLGASFLLFPYDIGPIRKAADAVGALIGYDGSHVLGLIAGGAFQQPLAEGADLLIGSTHKSFFGPQGGLLLTNRDDIWQRASEQMLWRTLDNVHWNRVAGLAQALAEHQAFGADFAQQVVENAKVLAGELDRRGLPVRFKAHGYTESHQILLDENGLKQSLGLTPQEFSSALERSNLIVDAVARIGTSEVTRLGAAEAEMGEIAGLVWRAARGENVKGEVVALRSRLILSYAFGT